MIYLSLPHLHGLMIAYCILGLSLVAFSEKKYIRITASLLLWTGLIYSAFISFISFDGLSTLFSFTGPKSGILFLYSACIMLPAFLNYSRYESVPVHRNISFYPFLLFFLIGFDHPLIWFAAYEGLSYLLIADQGYFHSESYRIRHLTGSLVIFTAVLFMSVSAGNIITTDIAGLLLFSGLILRLYTPTYQQKSTGIHQRDLYYLTFLQLSFSLILLIKVNPIVSSFYAELTGVFLLITGIVTCLSKYYETRQPETLIEISITSLFLPLILLSTSPSTHQYTLYIFLFIPLITLFAENKRWTIPSRGYLLAIMTIHGIPLTAGSILWVHYVSDLKTGSLYSYLALAGILILLAFWIFLYGELIALYSKIRVSARKIIDTYLLFTFLVNLVLWFFLGNFSRFFGF
jgi:hypothetical protein